MIAYIYYQVETRLELTAAWGDEAHYIEHQQTFIHFTKSDNVTIFY